MGCCIYNNTNKLNNSEVVRQQETKSFQLDTEMITDVKALNAVSVHVSLLPTGIHASAMFRSL